jgi:metallophosphoesterase (TIGR00282 family)
VNLLFIGDVVGRPGRRAVHDLLPRLRADLKLDLVIANGENVAAGIGLTADTAAEVLNAGVDLLTTGNHVYAKKEVYEYLDRSSRVLRPANYPPGAPGRGTAVVTAADGTAVGVLNLVGRVFMDPLDCPFRVAEREIQSLAEAASVIIVDLHAEATSEKMAFARHFDGQVSAVIGTHTHVQTADEKILPGGTAFITDVGMTGPDDSIIGMSVPEVVKRFLTQMPARWQVPNVPATLRAVLLSIDPATGRSLSIRRIAEAHP